MLRVSILKHVYPLRRKKTIFHLELIVIVNVVDVPKNLIQIIIDIDVENVNRHIIAHPNVKQKIGN